MKKFLVLLSFFFVIVSCSKQPDTNVYHKVEKTNDVYRVYDDLNIRVVIIDSCEYLIGSRQDGIYQGYGYLSHKGNCKYCAERRKRELQNVNKSHKSNGR